GCTHAAGGERAAKVAPFVACRNDRNAQTPPRAGFFVYRMPFFEQVTSLSMAATNVSSSADMIGAPAVGGLRRILVKLSGEALLGEEDYGIDTQMLKRIASEVREVTRLGLQVAVVVGGGNIFRGAGLARAGMDRVTGDHMGM